jgi:hypothetical protein
MRYLTISLFALIALLLGAGLWKLVDDWRNANYVVATLESLNGGVGDFIWPFGPDELIFSLEGLKPLVTDDDIVNLSPSLRKLNIRFIGLTDTSITDFGFKELVEACHETLHVLEMTGTQLSDHSLTVLRDCPELYQVSIPVELLTPSGISDLVKIKSLEKVIVYGCNDDDARVKSLVDAAESRFTVETHPNASFFQSHSVRRVEPKEKQAN